jgi:hypothetical protein
MRTGIKEFKKKTNIQDYFGEKRMNLLKKEFKTGTLGRKSLQMIKTGSPGRKGSQVTGRKTTSSV